jgi:hypothetical protein
MGQHLDQLAEGIAARLEIAELVETGASGDSSTTSPGAAAAMAARIACAIISARTTGMWGQNVGEQRPASPIV